MSSELGATRLLHFAREAGKNMRAAPALTVVAVLTIAVSLMLVGLFGIVLSGASTLLDGIAHDLRITAYLEPDADAAAIATKTSTPCRFRWRSATRSRRCAT